MALPQRSAGDSGHLADHNSLHTAYNMDDAFRAVYLGTSQHGASDTNDGLHPTRPVATMSKAMELLGNTGGSARPVGVVYVLPGRYEVSAGNEWRIFQRVAIVNYQYAHGTGPSDPALDPEAKVVVQPADGETMDYLVGLGEVVWNPAALDQWWHGGAFVGIMVWGRENDATFSGSVTYGVRCYQYGENSIIDRSRAQSCQTANWYFEGTHAGGMIYDIGTWAPGVGKTSPSTGGIGIRIAGSGSMYIANISGDSTWSPTAEMLRIEGSTAVGIGNIKAEGWATIAASSDDGTQDFGFVNISSLSWNVNVAGAVTPTDPAVFRYRRSNCRLSFRVAELRATNTGAAGDTALLDWTARDADARFPMYLTNHHPIGFEMHSKERYVARGGNADNWGGKTMAYGDTGLGERFYLLSTADGNFNPWEAWEYTNLGHWRWNNPDADGFGWWFESDAITEYQGAGVRHIAAGQARLWSSHHMAIGGSVGTPSVTWTSGTGTPEGAVAAAVGSLFSRTDGGASTSLYVKESGTGTTGWVAK